MNFFMISMGVFYTILSVVVIIQFVDSMFGGDKKEEDNDKGEK